MKKFIYCTDENLKNKLKNSLELILEKEIDGNLTWIFENNNKIVFSDIDINKLKFTNKFFI